MLSLSHTEAACYIAGFFDGEGYFGITKIEDIQI